MHKASSLLLATLAAIAAPAVAAAQRPDSSLVVSTGWLARHLGDPSVVVLAIEHERDDYDKAHIPGERFVDNALITRDVDGIHYEMPDADALTRLISRLGISATSHVIVEAPMLPMATRAIVTLQYAGVRRVSLLDGGRMRWEAEHRPTTRDVVDVAPSGFVAAPDRTLIADADWVRGKLGHAGVSLIDTRTDPEYDGGGERHGSTSTGHLHGARQLQWEQLTADSTELVLKQLPDLQRLYAERVASGDTVVTYCAIGYRASATYFVARYLGYPVKLFDGSYDQWSKLGYPTDTARVALRVHY